MAVKCLVVIRVLRNKYVYTCKSKITKIYVYEYNFSIAKHLILRSSSSASPQTLCHDSVDSTSRSTTWFPERGGGAVG